jgi:hypothetical protein
MAKSRAWTLSSDHAHFQQVRDLLEAGDVDVDQLIRLTDVRVAVDESTLGRATLTEDGLFLDGQRLSRAWENKAAAAPDSLRVLIINPGDRVLVEGDEDAPDGIYTVGEVDDNDADKRVYVESDDDFFGYVANESIKQIIREG